MVLHGSNTHISFSTVILYICPIFQLHLWSRIPFRQCIPVYVSCTSPKIWIFIIYHILNIFSISSIFSMFNIFNIFSLIVQFLIFLCMHLHNRHFYLGSDPLFAFLLQHILYFSQFLWLFIYCGITVDSFSFTVLQLLLHYYISYFTIILYNHHFYNCYITCLNCINYFLHSSDAIYHLNNSHYLPQYLISQIFFYFTHYDISQFYSLLTSQDLPFCPSSVYISRYNHLYFDSL